MAIAAATLSIITFGGLMWEPFRAHSKKQVSPYVPYNVEGDVPEESPCVLSREEA